MKAYFALAPAFDEVAVLSGKGTRMNRFKDWKVVIGIGAVVALFTLVRSSSAQVTDQNGLHWYRCNTHTHTAWFPNSDANASAEFAVQWYKKHGYQCLVITDHEHLTPVDQLNKEFGADGQFLVIPGEEITQSIKDSSLPGGVRWSHVNGINTNKVILPIGFPAETPAHLSEAYIKDAPSISLAETYVENIDSIYAAGGIPQINHPEGITGPHLPDLLPINRPFLFEVWNAFPSISPLGGVDHNAVVVPSFEALWDDLLSHGKTAWAVASDDVHDYFNFDDRLAPTPGKAWIMIQARELTLDAIMDALRRGHFYASTGVALKDYHFDSNGISMTIDPPFAWKSTEKETVLYQTRFIGRDGRVLADLAGLSPHYQFKGDEEYVRASIIDSDGRRAWTQPVFLDRRLAALP